MKKVRKIFFCGRVKNSESISGPTYVMLNIFQELKKTNNNCVLLNTLIYEPRNFFLLLKGIIEILCTSNNVINIHSFGYMIPVFFMLLSKIDRKNRYYLTLHGIASNEARISSKLTLLQEKLLVENFHVIICVSNLQKKILKKKYKKHKKVVVNHNGIEKNTLSFKEVYSDMHKTGLKLITAGGFSKIKSTKLIIDSVCKYNSENNPQIAVDIYGPVVDKGLFAHYQENKKVYNKQGIYYKGMIATEKLMEVYKDYDFCLCLSLYETFNLTALQSMRMATPIVVSEQCGVSELIENNINGFVVDINGLNKNKICELFYSLYKVNYKSVSSAAYKKALQHDWGFVSSRYLSCFLNK